MSMHGSLTGDMKTTDPSRLEKSQHNELMIREQKQLSDEQSGPTINPQHEYKLPPGLGLAMRGRNDGAEATCEIVPHDAGEVSEGSVSGEKLIAPSETGAMLQQHSPSLEVQTCSGTNS